MGLMHTGSEEVVTEVPEEETSDELKPIPVGAEPGPETVPRSVEQGLEQEWHARNCQSCFR